MSNPLINMMARQANGNMPGMQAVYDDMHADIMRESAEVQAMIAAYK